ncbi:hypothetical protein TorRG33x02_205150 [Trema orientale]|uniref:Uncharacterized protein n=1 Tax=Trema orientale TaxID=63057 RepID=A0A2P5EDU0_TREOI|nr:hypothetical protein TorRG33x02_205150 [Trema orientale]
MSFHVKLRHIQPHSHFYGYYCLYIKISACTYICECIHSIYIIQTERERERERNLVNQSTRSGHKFNIITVQDQLILNLFRPEDSDTIKHIHLSHLMHRKITNLWETTHKREAGFDINKNQESTSHD